MRRFLAHASLLTYLVIYPGITLAETVNYRLAAGCVISTDIEEKSGTWQVTVTLDPGVAQNLGTFTAANIGRQMQLVNADGEAIGDTLMIQGRLGERFRLNGLDAGSAKTVATRLRNDGDCGPGSGHASGNPRVGEYPEEVL